MIDLSKDAPTTLDAAVAALVAGLDANDKEFIKKQPPEAIHFNCGMVIRNAWGLWKPGAPLVRDIRARMGVSHGDDCSGVLLAGVWATVRGDGASRRQVLGALGSRRRGPTHREADDKDE